MGIGIDSIAAILPDPTTGRVLDRAQRPANL
jgi:hypothetical protein